MQLLRTVEKIETATDCCWWLLAALLLVSTPWPVLVGIEIGAIALATWHYGDQDGAA